jgi:hypothetical protein
MNTRAPLAPLTDIVPPPRWLLAATLLLVAVPAHAVEPRPGLAAGLMHLRDVEPSTAPVVGLGAEVAFPFGAWALVPAIDLAWRPRLEPLVLVGAQSLVVERRLARVSVGAGVGVAQLLIEDHERWNFVTGGVSVLARGRWRVSPQLSVGLAVRQTFFPDATLTMAVVELRWAP